MSFFLVVITVLSLMYGYIGWRLIGPAGFGLPVTLLLWAAILVLLVLPFLPIFMRFNAVEGTAVDVAAWIGYLSFGFMTLLFALMVTKDLAVLLVALAQKTYHLIGNVADSASEQVDPQRRNLITNSLNLGLLGVTGALTGYGMFQAMRRPDIVEIKVPIRNLPDDLVGFRIAQITDLHVSHTIKRPFVQTVVDTVNEIKPDLVALTGDLVDGSVRQLKDDVAPLADLNAPYGLFFVTGNHDYYSGVQPWIEEIQRLGFTVLLNEHRLIERGEGRLLLAGVTDYSGGRHMPGHASDPHKAIDSASDHHAKILLAHQPKNIFEAARAGYDYVISGHTHGGQYFPYHFLAAMAQPYISGFHQHGQTRIYVSRGTGYWGPQIRLGARSEITVHQFVCEE